MPNESEHIQLALHNIEVIHYLLDKPKFSDWTATVTFYTALHIVEAVFFHDTKNTHRRHGHNHEEREKILKGTRSYQNLYIHYRPLQSASVVARYLNSQSQRCTVFQQYLNDNQIKEKLIKHHLFQIIKTASKFLNATLAKSLFDKFEQTIK